MSGNTNTAAEQGTREAQREQAAAKRMDEKIRKLAGDAENKIAELNLLIAQVIEQKTFILLGFETWQAYVADVTSKNMPQLEAIARNSLIKFLTAKGMSVRSVAKALDTSPATVSAVNNGSTTGEPQNRNKGGAPKGVAQTRRTTATIAIDAIEAAVKKLDNTSLADMQALHQKLSGAALVVEAAIKVYQDRQAALVAEQVAKDERKAQSQQGNNPRTGQAAA